MNTPVPVTKEMVYCFYVYIKILRKMIVSKGTLQTFQDLCKFNFL